MPEDYNSEQEDTGPSKTQLKREMEALQVMGEQLITFTDAMLAKCELPESLLDSIEEYKCLANKHEAKRRLMQFIGKLMRNLDETHLDLINQQLNQNVDLDKKRFHELELLRERLIDGDRQTLETLIDSHPDLNIQQVRQMIRQAKKEREQKQTPVNARKLFKLLRELQSEQD